MRDFVILLVRVAALVVLTVVLLGGPEEFLRRVDQTVLDSISLGGRLVRSADGRRHPDWRQLRDGLLPRPRIGTSRAVAAARDASHAVKRVELPL